LKKSLVAILIVCVCCFFIGLRNTPKPQATTEIVEAIKDAEPEEIDIPYYDIFQKEAKRIGWDWQLLAAACYHESRFNPNAVNKYTGAKGLMQMMPITAERFGLNDSTVFVPADNIRAGADYIMYLQRTFSFITDTLENAKFVLASYNAGPAHIFDARRLAKKYGKSPNVWFDNTEYWLQQLENEEIANDSVVYYGTFNPYETKRYVRNVWNKYNQIMRN